MKGASAEAARGWRSTAPAGAKTFVRFVHWAALVCARLGRGGRPADWRRRSELGVRLMQWKGERA